jgi:MFS family permease
MLVVLALAAFGLLCFGFASASSAVVLGTFVLFGLVLAWLFTGVSTVFQKHTPNELMGRVNGVVGLAAQVPQAVGNVLGAALITLLFYRDLCYLTGAFVLLFALYLGTRPQQRRAAEPVEAESELAPLAG